MSNVVGQKVDRGQLQLIKQEKPTYRSPALTRRHGQHGMKLKYPEVRVAPCFRPSGLLASDLPVDSKHFVDKSMGLRHFSTKVCEKVKEKGRTNYNQVADELVAEYFAANNMNSEEFLERQKFDQKNIRRRVYDALNVLLAMNIICKRKKDIDWVGLPATKASEIKQLEEEKVKINDRLRQKKETIQDLIVQLIAYKSLVWKNREMERLSSRPQENALLYLPFVIVHTSKNTTVDCAVSGDRSEYLFNFDQPFEVQDDFEALKRLGFAYGLERNKLNPEMMDHIDDFIPPALRGYIPKILQGELSGRQPWLRAIPQVQYAVNDGPSEDCRQHAMLEQSSSEHSSDGSYGEMGQPVYTVTDGYPYAVPYYDSEMGDEMDMTEATGDYPTYSMAGPSTAYEPVAHGSRSVAIRQITSMPRSVPSISSVSEYSTVGPSTSQVQQCVPRVVNAKRTVYVPSSQVFRKDQEEVNEGIVYTQNGAVMKRTKTEDSMYNM